MSIHKSFYKHPKVERCSLAAIGLWTLAHCWCRDHRKKGLIPTLDAVDLALGAGDLIAELLHAGLWIEVDGAYLFNDWLEYNPEDSADSVAGELVSKTISADYPDAVRRQITARVSDLLGEGIHPQFIEPALLTWAKREGASVGLLPLLVTDAIKAVTSTNVEPVMRRCWVSGDINPLREFGYFFAAPDPPKHLQSIADIRAFMLKAKREWVEQLQNDLKAKAS